MAVKDRTKHYEGLRDPAGATPTPNTVSRNIEVGDRSLMTIVWQSGKAILDSELQAGQEAAWWDTFNYRRWQTPSGWFRGTTHYDSLSDFTLESAPVEVEDDIEDVDGSIGSVGSHGSIGPGDAGILPDRTMINCILLPQLECVVAGHPIIVEYTYTRTPGWNLIPLPPSQIYDGTEGTVKRTDFLFLEVWYALVAPSPKASGQIQVADNSVLVAGDLVTIAGTNLTAVAVPGGVDTFVIGANENATAYNIATAINDAANSFDTIVNARVFGDTVTIESVVPGTGDAGPPQSGNFITLSVTTVVVGAMVASGATLTGGANRYAKPTTDQDALYRHGNVLSPWPVWLQDEIVDPVVDAETTQRIQLQYRIRSTGTHEGVNYKKHPDGFSDTTAAPGPAPTVYAQGGTSGEVPGYPFVPADRTSTWMNSSAEAYDTEDTGLWVAGDGSDAAAEALGALDGYVYAIPLCFVHRHNDVSSSAAGFKGFDPVSNANGAPCYQHLGYNGPLGAIPAGASDRPDSHYCDVIDPTRILDLRRHILLPGGLDTASELQYQIQSLLDGTNHTWSIDTSSKQDLGGDSGDISVQHLVCNEVGRSHAHDGNNVTSGDTQRGEFIRDFDHISRRFGDQSIVERVVFAFYPGDRAVAPAVAPGLVNPGKYVTKAAGGTADVWTGGDTLHLNLEELDATTLGGIFQGTADGGGSFVPGGFTPSMAEFAPIGTVITDVLGVYHDDGNYGGAVDQTVKPTLVQGLGTMHLEVTLDENGTTVTGGLPAVPYDMVESPPGGGGSPRRIFVEVEITYPLGTGITDTPDLVVEPDGTVYDGSKSAGEAPGPGPIIENDAGQRPNDFEALEAPWYRDTYREVHLEYIANDTTSHDPAQKHAGSPVGSVNPETIVSRDRQLLYTPRRIYGSPSKLPTVTDAAVVAPMVIDPATTEYGSSSRQIGLTAALSGAGQTLCNVTYFPQDPIPNYGVLGGGYQVSVYFRSNAPQTAGVKEGDIKTSGDGVIPTTLNVEPLFMGPAVWSGQVGSGSQDRGYPYGASLDQITINDGTPPMTREWYFCATANIAIDDFDADTGLLRLNPFVQADTQNVLQFGGTAGDESPRVDAEFRAYYPFAADWVYRPTVMSQPLYGAVRHKVMFPFLARVTEEVHAVDGNGILFRKNEVALIVLSRFAELDEENNVRFTDSGNTTSAALYRTRNMLIVVGDRHTPVPAAP